MESVRIQKTSLLIFDLGGQDKLRPLWKHYLEGAEAIIFVVDSSDRARLVDVKRELDLLVNDPLLRDAAFLILANKADLQGSLGAGAVATELETHKFPQKVTVQETSALSGEGLDPAFQWLTQTLN
jgi:ADP-ribosylation factor protein 1